MVYLSTAAAAAFIFAPYSLAFQPVTTPLHSRYSCRRENFSNLLASRDECPMTNDATPLVSRRSMVSSSAFFGACSLILEPKQALAGIDPAALKNLKVEGDDTGVTTRLRQIEAQKVQPTDSMDIAFEELPSGVSFRQYREGKGDAVVQPGSKIAAEMTIRCRSFATANEPGGLKYFSTKEDTDFNELAWTVGSGEILPGLEDALMGMRRNSVRRIEVPSTLVFAAKKAGQLPLPTTKDGKRRFENLFKTDATLLFEVLVTRIK